MKKVVVTLIIITILVVGFLFVDAKRTENLLQNKVESTTTSDEEANDSSIQFKIIDSNKRDLGKMINLNKLDANEICFIFDYLPFDYYTGLYLDGEEVQQPTGATKLEFGFYLDEDKNSQFLKKGKHKIDIKIVETKEDIKKRQYFEEISFEYSIQ
ncbi:hypothetical protein [Enterococcus thailandicus]|uniref:hypothetical protein n=1 Tax=Enterococcus thailandicus TaxID=417368 RepID=UPI0022EBEB98|nr:hypothetical protein [Enterococcus thailandicus]MDA3965775.1 hypothetical protein [Enterococcus thailandicus]